MSFGEEKLDIPAINTEQQQVASHEGLNYKQQHQLNMQPMNEQQDSMDMRDPSGEMMIGHESMGQYNVFPRQGWGNSYPAAPGQELSKDSDDSTPHSTMLTAMKQQSPEPADQELTKVQKKSKPQKKKKKKGPKEPQKPLTAYQPLFNDTQAAIKGQDPSISFGEVSKIVSSMWNPLGSEPKGAQENEGMGDMNGQQQQQGMLQSPMGLVPNPMNMPQHNNSYMQQQQVAQYPQHMQHVSPHPMVSSSPPVFSGGPAASAVRPSSGQQDAGQGAMHPSNSCIRRGCPNVAILDDQWEDEYCSNECAVNHCRDIYLSWVASNKKK